MFYILNMSVNEARIITCIVNLAAYSDDDKSVLGRGGGVDVTLEISITDQHHRAP